MAHADLTQAAAGEAISPRRRSRAASLEAFLGTLVEIPAALLVVAEIVILFAGVVSRYGLHSPLIWSDELASILFLWLAMLGAAVAFRRAEHMRMTAVVASARPAMRAYLDMFATCAALAFLLMIVWPSYDYAYEESFITTPALQISNSWRAAALPVGICLMGLFAFLRLLRAGDIKTVLSAILSVAAVILVFWLLKGTLKPLGNLNLIIFFVGVAGFCVFAGVPIAFAFGLAIFGYLALTTHTPLMVLVGRMDEGMSHLILLAVPLFVFLGLLIEMTGMARAMVAFLASLLGHVRGGLHYVLVGAMYLVSGISGSKAADMAAVAPVLFPEMRRRGSHPGELAALLASSSAMSETIPPSLVLITIGSVANVSITALFTGGLLPAAVAAVALVVMSWYRSRHMDISGGERARIGQIIRTFVIAVPGLTLPFVIRAAVIDGVATATEVSTVGVVYTALLGMFVYRQFDWRRIYPILVDTVSLTGAVMLIIGAATAMAWALTQSGFSQWLVATMATVPGGKLGFLAITAVTFVILGSVLEGIPAIVLFGPLLFPVAKAMGVHEVHYAMVIILAMGIGLFAPPFGVGFYGACAIGRVSPDDALGRMWPYLAALAVALAIVVAVPWLSIGFL